MRLLIVDDEPTNLKLLHAQLEAEGHSVVQANNGVEALQTLRHKKVDGIISDILMPEMDGYRLCLEVRKQEKLSGLPFIFYTSTYSSPQDRELAKTVGADCYLSKPSPVSDIVGALNEALQKTRPRIAVIAKHDESYVLKQYNASLVNKLEQRNSELEHALTQLRSSEEWFRAAFEQAGVGMALRGIDPRNSRWLRVNQKLCEILGYTQDELLQLTSVDVTPLEDRNLAVDYNEKIMRGEITGYTREKRYLRKDGRIIWTRITLSAVHDADGKPDHVISVIEDISERKETDQRFRTIFDHAGIGITMRSAQDRNSPWVQVNDHFCKLLGYTREELLKLSSADITPEDEQTDAIRDSQRLLKGEVSSYSREKQVVRKDGQRVWVLMTVVSLPGSDGRPENLIATYHDITQRKLADISIRRLNRVYALLSGINALITRVQNMPELQTEACRIAVEQGNFGAAWIGKLDRKTGGIVPVAWAGDNAEILANSPSSATGTNPLGTGVAGKCLLEKRPIFVNDLAAAPDIGSERRKKAIQSGYRSTISIPLISDGDAVAAFTLYAREADFFDKDEVGLLVELVSNLSIGIESIFRKLKIEKLSRIRAVSGEINAAIVRIRDRDTLLRETCRIAQQHGGFDLAWVGTVDPQREELFTIAASGFPAEIVDHLTWKDFGAGQRTLREALKTRAPYVRQKLSEGLPAGTLRQHAINHGYASSVCLPLEVDEKVVAMILLFTREEAFFNSDELALLKEVVSDVSFTLQTIARQEELDQLSYYDPLTGLPNRTLFMDRTGQQMRSRGNDPRMVALILIDIERFRYINETFGRNGGDELLKIVAQRLQNAFDGKDYLARTGANSFGIIMRGMTDSLKIVHAVEDLVLTCFHKPFCINGSELRVAAKAGVAVFPADGEDADRLYRNAEAALGKARESGERYLFYATDMNARAAQTLALETKLRRALETQAFVLHYQPKYRLTDMSICGMEALIRWQDPLSGLVAPGIFIPLLEETGLILDVGKWALNHALAQHREWTRQGLAVPRIAVNVSAIQLQQKNFVDVIINTLAGQGSNADALELEITESLLMKDVQASIGTLSILRGMGITLAMDDFGTGYSSLAYISRLPITSLKIDREFITGMRDSPQNMSIVTTIIALAHSMNLKVVAEGVETEEQADLLKTLNCDEVQGYLFSKPLPGQEMEMLLRAAKPAP